MSIQLLVDVNLSPEWIAEFDRHGFSSVHWSTVGDPRSPDVEIMEWARDNEYVVFTYDLDFGALVALTHANGPGVLQVRGHNELAQESGHLVIASVAVGQRNPIMRLRSFALGRLRIEARTRALRTECPTLAV